MLRCQSTTFMIVDSSLVLHTGTFVPQHVAPPGYVRAGGWDYSVVWGHHQGVFQCYAVSISKKWMVQTCLKQKYLIYRCDRILFCKSCQCGGRWPVYLYSFNTFWYAVHLRALDQRKWFSLCDAVPNFFAGPIQALHPWFRNLVCGSLPRCCTVQLVTAPCRRLGRAVQKSICGCVFHLSHIQESFVSKTDCEVDETVATCCWLGHIGAKSLILILFEPMNVPHSVGAWSFACDTLAGKTKGSF